MAARGGGCSDEEDKIRQIRQEDADENDRIPTAVLN